MSLTTPKLKQTRQKIRKEKRANRNALSLGQQHLHSQKICRALTKTPEFLSAKTIGFYLDNDGEVSLTSLISYAQKIGKHCFLPRIEKRFNEKKSMVFRRYQSKNTKNTKATKNTLTKNIYGIYEPRINSDYIAPKNIDLIIMPLVAFDKKGTRLGMGGGFYDRAFQHKIRFPHSKPALIGVAHHSQISEYIPKLEWDVPTKYVITENGKVSKH